MRIFLMNMIFLIAIVVGVLQTGCATSPVMPFSKPEVSEDSEAPVRFSENNNVMNINNRNYRKMTKSRLEEESELHAQAGSMWVMEGQNAYLFAQNKARREGDLLNVKIEGPAQKQVELKVNVIKTLLKQLEEEEKKAKEGMFTQPMAEQGNADGRAPAAADPKAAKAGEARPDDKRPDKAADKNALEESTAEAVQNVPTRIVEKLADGNYRVKGQQPFMIGKREYKVIVTGVVRPEDFNDEGLSSNKLLDPQFDVVSLRKKETL